MARSTSVTGTKMSSILHCMVASDLLSQDPMPSDVTAIVADTTVSSRAAAATSTPGRGNRAVLMLRSAADADRCGRIHRPPSVQVEGPPGEHFGTSDLA